MLLKSEEKSIWLEHKNICEIPFPPSLFSMHNVSVGEPQTTFLLLGWLGDYQRLLASTRQWVALTLINCLNFGFSATASWQLDQ